MNNSLTLSTWNWIKFELIRYYNNDYYMDVKAIGALVLASIDSSGETFHFDWAFWFILFFLCSSVIDWKKDQESTHLGVKSIYNAHNWKVDFFLLLYHIMNNKLWYNYFYYLFYYYYLFFIFYLSNKSIFPCWLTAGEHCYGRRCRCVSVWVNHLFRLSIDWFFWHKRQRRKKKKIDCYSPSTIDDWLMLKQKSPQDPSRFRTTFLEFFFSFAEGRRLLQSCDSITNTHGSGLQPQGNSSASVHFRFLSNLYRHSISYLPRI